MERFRELGVLGRGNYGTALLCEEIETGEKLVIKKIAIYDMSDTERDQAKQEVVLLSSLTAERHPCIVQYKGSFIQDGNLHILMEYCDSGDLASKIKAARKAKRYFAEEQVLDWFAQLTFAVAHIHSHRVLHRDLKSQNVFLTKTNMVRLGDFGIARVLEHTMDQAKTVVGTPYFMAPEVCEGKQYSQRADIWALGCVLYELCTLQHAFQSNNLLGLVYKIVQEKQPSLPPHYSADTTRLVDTLLSKDPASRLSAEGILALPFIRDRVRKFARLDDGTTAGLTSPIMAPSVRRDTRARTDSSRRPEDASGPAAGAPGMHSPVHMRAGAAVVDLRRGAASAAGGFSSDGGSRIARQTSGFSDVAAAPPPTGISRRASADGGFAGARETVGSRLAPLETGDAKLVSPRPESLSSRYRAQQAAAAVAPTAATPTSAGGIYMYRPSLPGVRSPDASPQTSRDSGASAGGHGFDTDAMDDSAANVASSVATPLRTHSGASSRPPSAGVALPVSRTPHAGAARGLGAAGMQVLSSPGGTPSNSRGSAGLATRSPPQAAHADVFPGSRPPSGNGSRPSSSASVMSPTSASAAAAGKPIIQRVSRKSRPGAVSAGGVPIVDTIGGMQVMTAGIDPPKRPVSSTGAPALVRQISVPAEEIDEDVSGLADGEGTLPPAALLPAHGFGRPGAVRTPMGSVVPMKTRSYDDADAGRSHVGAAKSHVVHLSRATGRDDVKDARAIGFAPADDDEDAYAHASSAAKASHMYVRLHGHRASAGDATEAGRARLSAPVAPAPARAPAPASAPTARSGDEDAYSDDFDMDDETDDVRAEVDGILGASVQGDSVFDDSDRKRGEESLSSLAALARSQVGPDTPFGSVALPPRARTPVTDAPSSSSLYSEANADRRRRYLMERFGRERFDRVHSFLQKQYADGSSQSRGTRAALEQLCDHDKDLLHECDQINALVHIEAVLAGTMQASARAGGASAVTVGGRASGGSRR